MGTKTELQSFLKRAETFLERAEALLPPLHTDPDWLGITAFRWRKQLQNGYFQPIIRPHRITLDDLQGIDVQKMKLERNTRQFIRGFPANNALLWGAKGSGKSSLIKALLSRYADDGLRLIEVDKYDLIDLSDIVESLYHLSQHFIIFCDDLSFDNNEPGYKALKSMLDGSLSAMPNNVLIYATSNRRHLLPEFQHENQEAHYVDGELHPGESSEEKISLAERFGLWLSFYPFKQDEYLAIVNHWLHSFGVSDTTDNPEARHMALQWALSRGSRSGRVAWQFAKDCAGQTGLKKPGIREAKS